MRRFRFIHFAVFACAMLMSCELDLRHLDSGVEDKVEVERFDRLECQYLTTGDFSAIQQMNTDYPMETRTLIEDILQIGEVNDPQINKKFLTFYQDSTLQTIISDAEAQYANIDDINELFNKAFDNLKERIPSIPIPRIYAQIGALDQSVVIGDHSIGISLDKYLGERYKLYSKYYTPAQVKSMTREYIVPDCMSFYLLSLYPMSDFESRPQVERDLHMGKVMWVCNQILEKKFFKTKFVDIIDRYVSSEKSTDLEKMLKDNDYEKIKASMKY